MVFKEIFYDKQVVTMKKVLIVWILLVCFLLTGCTSQRESSSSQMESSQGTAVSTASEALESRGSVDQDIPRPTAPPWLKALLAGRRRIPHLWNLLPRARTGKLPSLRSSRG